MAGFHKMKYICLVVMSEFGSIRALNIHVSQPYSRETTIIIKSRSRAKYDHAYTAV